MMAAIIRRTSRCLIYGRLLKRYDHAVKVPGHMVKQGNKKKAEGAFYIKILTPNEKEQVLNFLVKLFFRDEPIAKAVKLLDGPNDRCAELEEYIGLAMADGISVKAVDDNGKLAGVVINSFLLRGHSTTKEDVENISNPKFKCIIRFLTYLETECQLWKKVAHDCNKVVDLKIASTDPKWRGRSVMKKLVAETESIAKMSGAGAVHLVATSLFSARAAERLGYKKIYSVKYADKPDGPQPDPPHLEASVFMKLL